MRIFKSALVIALALAMLFVMLDPGIKNSARFIIMAICVLGVLWLKRGDFYFASASARMNSKPDSDSEKIIKSLEKALAAGLSWPKTLAAGAILIQKGKSQEGKKALLDLEKNCKDKSLVSQARTFLSQAFYAEGDLPQALKLTDQVRQSSYRDRNFYVNACALYLLSGRVQDFSSLIAECRSGEKYKASPAITDFLACDQILKGNWNRARSILSHMLRKADYDFADPYVHLAQVKMHFGSPKEAQKLLQTSLDTCLFAPGAVIGREFVEKALLLLKDEKACSLLIESNDKNPLSLINGIVPDLGSPKSIPEA